MKVIISVLMLLAFNSSSGQSALFHLKDIHYLSDVNFNAISNIDKYPLDNLIDSVFNVQAGKYIVYRFERFSVANSKDNLNSKEYQELIIAKVSGNIIVEAYYCPLSWREPPISSVVLVSQRKVRLKKRLSTKKMKFKNINPNGLRVLKDGDIMMFNE